ncbi:MAG: hypothetical protein ACK5DJ_00970 [Bacteroidota bacterium]|jgi:hypothetical protein
MLLHFLLFSDSAVAQSSGEQVEKKLDTIEKYIYQNPVGAKSELLKLLKFRGDCPDSTIGKVYMNLSTVLGMTNRLDSAIQACNEAMRLLPERSGSKASVLKTRAIIHRLKGEWKPAEEALTVLLQLNDSLWKNDLLKAMTLQEYASLRLDQYDYNKATSLYLEALKLVNTLGTDDPLRPYTAVKLRVNLAEAYMRSGNYHYSIRELNSAMPVLDSLRDLEGYVRAGYQLASAYIRSGKAITADSLLNVLLPITIDLHNDELQSYILYKKGESRAAQKEYAGALPYYRSAYDLLEKNNSPVLLECATAFLRALKNTGNDKEAEKVLKSEVLKKILGIGLPEQQLEFKKSAIHFVWKDLSSAQQFNYTIELLKMSDSVAAEKDRRSALQLQAEYQFERQQENEKILLRENEVLRQEERFKRNQLYLFISIGLLILTVLVLLILRLRQRSRNNEKLMKVQEQEIQFQKERRGWAEREKDLRDQLIQQQKAELVRIDEDASDLRSKLEQIVTEQHEEKRKEILTQIEKSKNEKHSMDSLLSQFNAIYPTFASSLVKGYPELTQADVQFCTLYRMNLTTKEISMMLNIETRSVYIKKYRIVEKMGLSETEQFEQVLFGMG